MRNNKKGTRILFILAMVLMIGGGMLVGAGMVSGGSLEYLHIDGNVLGWGRFGNIGIFTGDRSESGSNSTWTTSLAKKTKIKIDANLGDIEVRKGDRQEAVFQDISKDDVTIKENGNELEIVIDVPTWFNIGADNCGKLIVYLEDDQYDLDIDDHLGDIKVDGLTFDSLEIDCNLGDVKVTQVETNKLSIDQNCGDITVDGSLRNKTEIENDLGDVTVTVRGNKAEYDYQIKNNLGDTRVDGERSEINANIKTNNGKDHRLEVTNHLGDIDVEFKK